MPAWVWWLLAAILIALAVAIPLLIAARRRRDWGTRMDAATDEAAWFARDLIPQLQQEPSAEQAAGGWHLARGRVAAAEDALTGLGTTAPTPAQAERAHALRDAVRSAKDQLDAATGPGAVTIIGTELVSAARTLEAALPPVDPTPPPTPAQ